MHAFEIQNTIGILTSAKCIQYRKSAFSFLLPGVGANFPSPKFSTKYCTMAVGKPENEG